MASVTQSFFSGDLKNRRVLVLGAGYLGRTIAQRSRQAGAEVLLLTRTEASAEALRSEGFQVIAADVAELASWAGKIGVPVDLAVFCVSSGGGGLEAYSRCYQGGASALSSWLSRQTLDCLVYTGSCSVYPQADASVVTEESPVADGEGKPGILLETEKLILQACPGARRRVVLRLAGLYGPQRHLLLDAVLAGESVIPGKGEQHLNLLHVEDAASAVLAAWRQAPAAAHGVVYNAADGGGATRREIVDWLAQRLGRSRLSFDPQKNTVRASRTDRVILSEKLRKELLWVPRYPSFREGYEEILLRLGL